MEFNCERGNLFETLSNIQSVIPGRTTHPVISNVLLQTGKNTVSIIGTDLDMKMIGKIEAKVISDGSYALPAKKFFELLRELEAGEVYVKRSGNRTNIVQGKGKFVIAGVEEQDFPNEEMLGQETGAFSISSADLSRILEKTGYSMSVDVGRIALSGLYINVETNKVTSVATDGHRLTILEKECDVAKEESAELLVPAKTVNQLSRMLGDEDQTVKIIMGRNTARFEIGNYQLTSKLISEKFPPFKDVIPKKNTRTLIAEKDVLIAAIKRASVLSNPFTHLVKFELSENSIRFECSDYDVGGEAEEEIKVEYADDPMGIGFNSNYFLEVLKHIESDEVKVLMKDSLSPALIMPLPQKEGEEYLSVLMPLRIPEESD